MVTTLAGLIRALPFLRRRSLARGLVARLSRGMNPIGHRRIGPIVIGLDARDPFQRDMLLGVYEVEAEEMLRATLRPGDTYVDVGAQLGYTAAIAADCVGPTGRLVLVEPDPVALARLESHLDGGRRRPEMPRVDVVAAAFSDGDGCLRFHVAPTLGHSRVLRAGESGGPGRLVEVPARRGDEILTALEVGPIRLLKMDVEGHELAALTGLQETLASGRVDAVLIEKNHHLMDEPVMETALLHALVARHGMRARHLERGGWATRESLASTDTPLENLLFEREPAGPGGARPFTREEMEALVAGAATLDPAGAEARRIVRRVRSGDLAGGLAKGEEFLQHHPEAMWFRGHVAWWCLTAGRKEAARRHYELLAAANPGDEAVATMLARMKDEG